MKSIRTIILTAMLSCAGLLAVASVVFAQTGIINTKHNLSSAGSQVLKGQTAELCIYCHTPHGGQKAVADDTGPLWNRNYDPTTGVAFQVYASPTLDTTPSNPPTSVSKACLSCHDGTLGLNQLLNNAGPGSGTSPDNATDTKITGVVGPGTGTNNMALIGRDLRDDHPVSIVFADAKSYGTGAAVGVDSHAAGFRGITIVGTRDTVQNGSITLPLYSGKVECGSCHDPHEERSKTEAADPTKSVYFLRVANDNSQLCLTCHLK